MKGAKYAIHASIRQTARDTYVVKVHVEPAFRNADGTTIEENQACEPCSYAQARTACYKFVADIAHRIGKAGGEVADVIITDAVGI